MPELVLEKPRKVALVESLVEQLSGRIRLGVLKPRDKLPSKRHLIQMLGVGRSSAREALQGLAMIGLVESRAGQGTFVTDNAQQQQPDVPSAGLSTRLQGDTRIRLTEARRWLKGTWPAWPASGPPSRRSRGYGRPSSRTVRQS